MTRIVVMAVGRRKRRRERWSMNIHLVVGEQRPVHAEKEEKELGKEEEEEEKDKKHERRGGEGGGGGGGGGGGR